VGIFIFQAEHRFFGAFLGLYAVAVVIGTTFNVLVYKFNIIKVDENGIKVRNAFAEIIDISWKEMSGVYIYQFNGTKKIRVLSKISKKGVYKYRKYGRHNLGGTSVFVPKKIPTKWIFIDDGRGENGENILEYLVSLRKGSVVRMKYKEKILEAIKENYQGEITEKTIEIREM